MLLEHDDLHRARADGARVVTLRWEGNWAHWACPGCGSAMTALQAPAEENERCGSCKAEQQYQETMQSLVERLQVEVDQWKVRALSAEKRLREEERNGGRAA